jgi:hypothetical protein
MTGAMAQKLKAANPVAPTGRASFDEDATPQVRDPEPHARLVEATARPSTSLIGPVIQKIRPARSPLLDFEVGPKARMVIGLNDAHDQGTTPGAASGRLLA